MDSTRPFWRDTDYDHGHSSISRWHASMRAARRQGVFEVVRCGTRPSSRVRARTPPVQHLLRGGYIGVRARTPPVQHLLRGGYIFGLHAFQAGQRYHGHFGTLEEEKGAGGRGGGGRQLSESQSSRRRYRVCFTLTMPRSSRNHPSS